MSTRLNDTSFSSLDSSTASTSIESQTVGLVVVVANSEEESSEEYGTDDDIEHTVPDHLGSGGDEVGSFSETPADGVGDQHEGDVASSGEVGAAVGTVSDGSGAGSVEEERRPDVEHSNEAEGIETPLVGAADQSTNETADDSGDGHEESGHDIGEREAGGEENLKEEEREGDEPLDVAHIPDLTSTLFTEFGLDRSSTEIRGHGEVCNTVGNEDDRSDLVEEAGALGSQEIDSHRAEQGEREDGEHRPQEVRASIRDVDLSIGRVDIDSVRHG